MCGIAGVINYNKVNISKIKNNLSHRGPDSNSLFLFENTLFAHTRLSIIDLNAGSQPFCVDEYVLILNGEIYNHIELRNKHLSHINFKTHSDTETLLHMYIRFKQDVFKYLDGMYAFAILNKKTKNIFLAVDKSGKKPIYIYQKNNVFFFASELNVLKDAISLEVDEEKIQTYLKIGYFPFGITPFQNVNMLEAGHFAYINIQERNLKRGKYFCLEEVYNQEKLNLSLEESVDLVETNLYDSIKNRLISSDIDVGAFLSGGIDSSLIVAIASKIGFKLKTFTVRFNDSNFDESSLANMVAMKYNTNHNIIDIDLNLKQDIEKILFNYGEPFMDPSAIPSFYVSQEAKKYLSVILSGDGADELFAGYRRYVATKHLSKFKNTFFVLKILPLAHNKQSILGYLNRLSVMMDKKDLEYYLSATSDVFDDIITLNNTIYTDKMNALIKKINNSKLSDLSKMLYMDFTFILFNDLLKKMDIASMSHSLEVRSPFLASNLIDIAPRIQDQHKINGIKTKFILRELGKKYLPKALINAPKRGFEVPLTSWVDNELKDNILESLKNGYHLNYLNKNDIDKVVNNKVSISKNKRAKILWSLFSLNTWYNQIK